MKLTSSRPPARVEVGLRTALHDTTSGGSAGSGDNSVPTIPLQTSIEKLTLGSPGEVIFKDFPKRSHGGPQGDPKGVTESPRAPQGVPKRAKGSTKEGQKEPNGAPEGPKGAPWHQKGSSKEAYIHKNSRSTAPAAVMLHTNPCACLFVPATSLHPVIPSS